ncbi:unnamed protein product, partial [Ectocarpus fasciculatus]
GTGHGGDHRPRRGGRVDLLPLAVPRRPDQGRGQGREAHLLREAHRHRPRGHHRGCPGSEGLRREAHDGLPATLRPFLQPTPGYDRSGRGRYAGVRRPAVEGPRRPSVRLRQGRRRPLQGHGHPRPRHRALAHGLVRHQRAGARVRNRRVQRGQEHPGAQGLEPFGGHRHGQHPHRVRKRLHCHNPGVPQGYLRVRPARRVLRHGRARQARKPLPKRGAEVDGDLGAAGRPAARLLHDALR